MFSKSQTDALALLDQYFSKTPEPIIKADVQAVSALNFAGSSAKDYFASFHKHLNYEPFKKTKIATVYTMPQVNTLSTVFMIENNLLYIKHVKPNIYSFKAYNFIATASNVVQYSKQNISIFNLIQA